MVRRKSTIILFLFIGILFCLPFRVEAKSLGTCNYTIDTQALGIGNLDGLYLKVTVNDDGSISNRKIGTSSGWSATPSGGLQLDKTDYKLQYSPMFEKNGKFYKAFKNANTCPDLQFINYNNNFQLSFNIGGGVSPGQYRTVIAKKNLTGGTSSTGNSSSSGNKTYCGGTLIKPVDAVDANAKLTFYTEGNKRKLKIELKGDSNTMEAGSSVEVAGITFTVSDEDIDKYWSDKCKSYSLYFERIGQDKKHLKIQTKRPANTENGAYSESQANLDNGKISTVENNATLDGLNQEYKDCNAIFDMTEGKLGWLIQKILDYIKIAGPIMVVLLSAIDFIRAIASSEEDAYKKAQSKLIIRLIAALALFLVPTIVNLLLRLVNGIADPTCGFR